MKERNDSGSSARRALLWGAAAVVVAWSGWILLQGDDDGSIIAASRGPAAGSVPPVVRQTGTVGPRAAEPEAVGSSPIATGAAQGSGVQRLAVRAERDAFGTRLWDPPAPTFAAPAASKFTEPEPAPVVIAAPAPPPVQLPFRYIGGLEGVPAERPQVFLTVGDKLIVAAAGEMLEGGFRLESIRPNELVFTHLQQGTTLRLPIPGAPS